MPEDYRSETDPERKLDNVETRVKKLERLVLTDDRFVNVENTVKGIMKSKDKTKDFFFKVLVTICGTGGGVLFIWIAKTLVEAL